jgi:hypothetical protein
MAEKLRIFVSATNDLDHERAAIGRAVAELPVQIGIEIRRTPAHGASYDDMFELVANCDRVYFLLGKDITAPAGAEWHLALQLERSILPLRMPAHLTPAAQEFKAAAYARWTSFRNSAELGRLVTLDMIRILQNPTNRYGLTVAELELLKLHSRKIQTMAPAAKEDPGGAEGGGVLLDSIERSAADDLLLEEPH